MNRWYAVVINAVSAALAVIIPALTDAHVSPLLVAAVLGVNAALHAIPDAPAK